MAKIVINMPDYMLNQIMIGCPFKLPSQFVTETYKIIRNGKILPKGHGDLKDIDAINLYEEDFYEGADYERVIDAIVGAPTIIEADKEGS